MVLVYYPGINTIERYRKAADATDVLEAFDRMAEREDPLSPSLCVWIVPGTE